MVNDAPSLSRRLLAGTILVGVLILCNLALFGVLLFRSLSEEELRRVLLETRSEAEELAGQIAGEVEREGSDLFTALVQEQETRSYIDRVLAKREIVQAVKIYDREGTLVFETSREVAESADEPLSDLGNLPLEMRSASAETAYDVVEVPVGDVGSFVIGLSRTEMDRRVQVLRAELVRSAAPIVALTMVLLIGAYLFILWLLRRGRRLEGRAREAEQMAYVGTLASGLAHEIRSPLNSLNLNMQMLEEEAAGGEMQSGKRLLAIARAEITRLEGLVTDFLSYARPRPLEPRWVAAVDVLERLRALYAGQARAGEVEIEVSDGSGRWEVEVDLDQMGQLLLNLMQNGIAAAEEAGRRPSIELGAERHGGRIALTVEDNGSGIGPEQREKVFEVFYSTRRGGTGLGLSIARRLALGHEAELSLHSRPGQGAVAKVLLPAARCRPAAAPQPALTGRAAETARLT
jgi:signal transduction histidine kinase